MSKRFEKLDDYYCPNCGKKDTIWFDNCSDDYYQGCTAYCIECNHSGNDINLYKEYDKTMIYQIMRQIGRVYFKYEVSFKNYRELTNEYPELEDILSIRELWGDEVLDIIPRIIIRGD